MQERVSRHPFPNFRYGRTGRMLEKPLDPVVSAEDLATIGVYLDQFKKDTMFLNNHRLDWVEQYPDQWVVVFGEELVARGPTVESALHAANEKNVPVHLAALEYLSSEPVSRILSGTAR